MIWLIESSLRKGAGSCAASRCPFPWLTRFRSPAEALRIQATSSPPSLILLAWRGAGNPVRWVRKLRQAAPRAQIITLRSWGRSDTVLSALRRLMLESTMPVPRTAEPPRNPYRITEREREVLRCMVSGLIKKEIAEYLSLSYHTVDNHERHLYHKLKVHTRTAAVAKAVIEHLC